MLFILYLNNLTLEPEYTLKQKHAIEMPSEQYDL